MTDSVFRPCAIIPSHDHWRALPLILAAARNAGLAVLIVDDGSGEEAKTALARLHDPTSGIEVRRLDPNRGKGAAVIAGFRWAIAAGYTHAVQIDADGQHDIAELQALLELARHTPDALITGVPVYDRSVPRARALGRWLTHVWVWIETLSLDIRDSMCGFRVYPLRAVMQLLDSGERLGLRMDFDTEIMVRLFWRGIGVVGHPVRVIYPTGNTSNFDLLRDNLRISAMHTRLVLEMPFRLPSLLLGRIVGAGLPRHWAALPERGFLWGLRICAAAYRLLGRRGCMALIAPVVLFFYLTGSRQRLASRQFLERAFAHEGRAGQPSFLDGYRHFLSFAGRMVDTFAAWGGSLPADTIDTQNGDVLEQAAADPRGALILVSHLGNVEISRATLDRAMRRRLVVLVHTKHAANYNRLLAELNPDFSVNMIQVTEIGPALAIQLKEHVERGDWIVIAGDRTPVTGFDRVSRVPFLGGMAPFPQGPYILGALMQCPVYALFCRREGGRYLLQMARVAEQIDLPRGSRDAALAGYAAAFAGLLQQQALADPMQWYNFFDFWAERPA